MTCHVRVSQCGMGPGLKSLHRVCVRLDLNYLTYYSHSTPEFSRPITLLLVQLCEIFSSLFPAFFRTFGEHFFEELQKCSWPSWRTPGAGFRGRTATAAGDVQEIYAYRKTPGKEF